MWILKSTRISDKFFNYYNRIVLPVPSITDQIGWYICIGVLLVLFYSYYKNMIPITNEPCTSYYFIPFIMNNNGAYLTDHRYISIKLFVWIGCYLCIDNISCYYFKSIMGLWLLSVVVCIHYIKCVYFSLFVSTDRYYYWLNSYM